MFHDTLIRFCPITPSPQGMLMLADTVCVAKKPYKNPILLQAKAHSGIHPLGQGGHVCSEMELLHQGISKHPIHEAIFGQPLVMLQAFFQGFGEFAMICRCPYRIWLVHHVLGEQCMQKYLIVKQLKHMKHFQK